jgi:hypothetical protein
MIDFYRSYSPPELLTHTVNPDKGTSFTLREIYLTDVTDVCQYSIPHSKYFCGNFSEKEVIFQLRQTRRGLDSVFTVP